jgi:hypothetical protein
MRWPCCATLLVLLASCSDGGPEPTTEALVPRIAPITPQPNASPGEADFLVDLEVRTRAGEAYPGAIVSWEPTHGNVLAPATTDADGRLQALWIFTLGADPSGTAAVLRACARREPQDPCGYSEAADVEIP